MKFGLKSLVLALLAGTLTVDGEITPTNGLIAFLPLNGRAADDSGNGHSGFVTATTPVSDVFGHPNGALAFDGQNSEIQIPINCDFSKSGFTFSAMFFFDKAYSEPAHQHYLMDGRDGDSGIVYANVDSGLIQALGTEIHPSESLNPRQWYHMVATHDNVSGNTQIYLDGKLIYSAHVDSGVDFVRSMILGRRFTGTEQLTGRLSDIRVYNYALSSQSISELYAYENQPHNLQQVVEASDPFIGDGNLINPTTGLPVKRPDQPTNNVIELSTITGDLRFIGSRGLILETNFTYLPRIAISSLSSNELAALLENQTAYAALTSFGSTKSTTAQSQLIECQLERIWQEGKSLQEKVQTRLEILDEMRAYNSAARDYQISVGVIGSAEHSAKNAAVGADALAGTVADNEGRIEHDSQIMNDPTERREALAGNNVVVDTTPNSIGQHDYEAKHVYNNPDMAAAYKNAGRDWHVAQDQQGALEQNAKNAQAVANSAANAVVNIKKTILASEQECEAHATWLASHGIVISSSPPFSDIPSLTIKDGVDFERAELKE